VRVALGTPLATSGIGRIDHAERLRSEFSRNEDPGLGPRTCGLDRWRGASTVSAMVHVHGVFWTRKGQPDRLGMESVTAAIHSQRTTMTPFGNRASLEFDAQLDHTRILGDDG
jgi:hypothetical protein